jgi:hypothetical protein
MTSKLAALVGTPRLLAWRIRWAGLAVCMWVQRSGCAVVFEGSDIDYSHAYLTLLEVLFTWLCLSCLVQGLVILMEVLFTWHAYHMP